MKGGNRGKNKKKTKSADIKNDKAKVIGGLEGQAAVKPAPTAKLSSKILNMKSVIDPNKFMQRAIVKEKELKQEQKIKKIEDTSKWSLKAVFKSRSKSKSEGKKRKQTVEDEQDKKPETETLGYSEINEGKIKGRRSFGEFARKLEREKPEVEDDDEHDKQPLKKRKVDGNNTGRDRKLKGPEKAF